MDLMALITRTYLVDDLDGSEDDVSTVTFTLDRTNYEIDLSASNADRLREKLEKFVNVASPVQPAKKAAAARRGAKAARTTKTAKQQSAPSGRDQTQAVRDWARSNGHEVSERGRIAKSIQEAFDAAHRESKPPIADVDFNHPISAFRAFRHPRLAVSALVSTDGR